MRRTQRAATIAALTTLALALIPSAVLAGSRTINFDEFDAETLFVNSDGPLRDRYASLGVHFTGPAANDGGAVLDVSSFSVTGESAPNALAFNTGVTYTAAQGGGVARGPETIMFDAPIHAASIRAGQAAGGTVRLTAFDGGTPVSTNFQTAQAALQTLDVAAARITSLRIEFSGTASVWDDLTWSTSPVSGNDAFATLANTRLSVGAPGVLDNDTDADGDHITASLQRAPANGTVDLRPDGSFSYTPSTDFTGVDSFDYRASDGTGNGNTATVLITVKARPTLLSSTVTNGWDAFPKFTKNTAFAVNQLPANSKVVVTCKTKKKKQQKKGCPYKKKTFKSVRAKSKLKLHKPFKKKKLPVGTRVTVTITATGFIGKQFTYTMRKSKRPKAKRLCIPPGGKPGKCK
jgi:Bacterial Ig domain